MEKLLSAFSGLSGLLGGAKPAAETAEKPAVTAQEPAATPQMSAPAMEAQRTANAAALQAPTAAIAQPAPAVVPGPVLEKVAGLLSTILPLDKLPEAMKAITQALPGISTQPIANDGLPTSQADILGAMLRDPEFRKIMNEIESTTGGTPAPTAQATSTTPQASIPQAAVPPAAAPQVAAQTPAAGNPMAALAELFKQQA